MAGQTPDAWLGVRIENYGAFVTSIKGAADGMDKAMRKELLGVARGLKTDLQQSAPPRHTALATPEKYGTKHSSVQLFSSLRAFSTPRGAGVATSVPYAGVYEFGHHVARSRKGVVSVKTGKKGKGIEHPIGYDFAAFRQTPRWLFRGWDARRPGIERAVEKIVTARMIATGWLQPVTTTGGDT